MDESKHLLTNALRSITGKDPLPFNCLNNRITRVQLAPLAGVVLGTANLPLGPLVLVSATLNMEFWEALLLVLFQWTIRMSLREQILRWMDSL